MSDEGDAIRRAGDELAKIRQELALLRAQLAALTELTQKIWRKVEDEDAPHAAGIGYGGAGSGGRT